MNLDLCKGFYEHEWQRHEQLQSAINTRSASSRCSLAGWC
jgi:hypothetical protein